MSLMVLGLLGLLVGPVPTSRAQVDGNTDALPLHAREPFDRIVLDAENGGVVLEVFPLEVDRTKPFGSALGNKFELRRLQDPANRRYSLSGQHVASLEIFPELLLSEAVRLVERRECDAAFPYVARLGREYPKFPGVGPLIEQFYLTDAAAVYRSGRYEEALLSLDEVFSRNPERPGLDRVLQRVIGDIVEAEFKAGDLSAVRRSTEYAAKRYGEVTKPLVEQWRGRLKEVAEEQMQLARQRFAAADPSSALAAARRALEVWPELPGVSELTAEILNRYPRVRVGVTQPYVVPADGDILPSPQLLWGTRRVRRLVRKELVEFQTFTADGAQYASRICKTNVARDRTQLTIQLNPESSDEPAAYELSRALLEMADRRQPTYQARWSEFLASLFASDLNTVEITLTRPTLRPETLLPSLPTMNDALQQLLAGDFVPQSTSGESREMSYRASEPRNSRTPAGNRSAQSALQEIVEATYETPSEAADALLKGEIDLLDRIDPADYQRLAADPGIQLVRYATPTVHAIVFGQRLDLLRSDTFRRGLLYSINRQSYVRDQLIGTGPSAIAQVLSGPFPVGASPEDPLGYAYDRRLAARDYDPSLGLVLLRLAQSQMAMLHPKDAASDVAGNQVGSSNATPEVEIPDRTGNPDETSTDVAPADDNPFAASPFPELVLCFPDSPLAAAACTSIAADLRRVGLTISLRALEPGEARPSDTDWDLLYVEMMIEEPFVDVPDLIIGQELLGRHGGLVWQSVRRLQEAGTWSEVRDQFAMIHKLAYDHTPIIPLWQVQEHLARRTQVTGIGENPVSLYQQVSQWRLAP